MTALMATTYMNLPIHTCILTYMLQLRQAGADLGHDPLAENQVRMPWSRMNNSESDLPRWLMRLAVQEDVGW